MASFKRSLVEANGTNDGYEVFADNLHIDGVAVGSGDQGVEGTTSADTFRRDLISVATADGTVTVTQGTEADSKEDAETPDLPAGNVVLAVGVMNDAGVESIELGLAGLDASISADESHVA